VESGKYQGAAAFVAIKTEPLGNTILVPAEQVAEYEALADSVKNQFQPETFTEKLLAQWIVSHQWRLRHLARLEEALYTMGQRNLGPQDNGESDLRNRKERIDARIPVTYEKEFKNLARQSRFLQKRLKNDTKELNQLLRDNPRSRRGLFLVPKPPKSE
jgi:hypothetical protein